MQVKGIGLQELDACAAGRRGELGRNGVQGVPACGGGRQAGIDLYSVLPLFLQTYGAVGRAGGGICAPDAGQAESIVQVHAGHLSEILQQGMRSFCQRNMQGYASGGLLLSALPCCTPGLLRRVGGGRLYEFMCVGG